MANYKIISNEERHFSEDAVANRAIAQMKRRMKGGMSLINWTVPHHLSKYHYKLIDSNQENPYYWIKYGEDYYIAVERVINENNQAWGTEST